MGKPIKGRKRRRDGSVYSIDELKDRTVYDQHSKCWNWDMSLNSYGYGQARHKEKSYLAHRLMYMLVHPEENIANRLICHKCDNRKCINPKHLYSGTFLTNMQDMYRRGRAKPTGSKGEAHFDAKLTEKKVKDIRRWHSLGVMGYRNLGKYFGVDRTVIRGIIKGKYWKNVK